MKVRSRVANLGDLRNPSLRQNVISGAITPSQIAVMTTEVCVYVRACVRTCVRVRVCVCVCVRGMFMYIFYYVHDIISVKWARYYLGRLISLVPRPHPLTRRNSVVNQVKFMGLAHTFVTM